MSIREVISLLALYAAAVCGVIAYAVWLVDPIEWDRERERIRKRRCEARKLIEWVRSA